MGKGGTTNDSGEPKSITVEWMAACILGNLALLMSLFEINPHLLSTRDFLNGYTLLHWAAKRGMLDVIDWVAEKDQDIEASLRIRSHSWSTPLHLAAESGRIAVIKRLIDLGADIKLRNQFGKKVEDVFEA